MSKTEVEIGEFKGNEQFKIFKLTKTGKRAVNEDGDAKSPMFNFGITKAEILLSHLEELKDYVERNKKS